MTMRSRRETVDCRHPFRIASMTKHLIQLVRTKIERLN